MPDPTNGSAVLSLKEKRDTLTPDTRKLVRRCMDHIESEFIDSLPELIGGVRATRKQSSISPTVSLNVAKRNNLKVKVDARIRAAREGLEFEAHLTDDGQLGLGWDEPDEEEEGAPAGFDREKDPVTPLHGGSGVH